MSQGVVAGGRGRIQAKWSEGMKTWQVLVMLLPTLACSAARERGGLPMELSLETLRIADNERLLPGRFEFRVVEGWMVRFDTAKGTYCSMENISDDQFVSSVLKYGQKDAEVGLPGGKCKD